jgi:hypothetical protein
MKEFRENYIPLSMKIYDIDGIEYEIKTKFLTAIEYIKLEKMIDDKKMKSSEKGIETMIVLCGEDKKFWERFSPQLLTEVTLHIYDERNKSKKKANNG